MPRATVWPLTDTRQFLPRFYTLWAESRQRHAHMDRALKKLDEDSEHLQQAYNAQRQEDITEEIEVILLSVGMLEEECYGQW